MKQAHVHIEPGNAEADILRRAEPLTLDRYDFSEAPAFDQKTFAELATGKLVKTGANAFILGGPGTGKSHLSMALAAQAIRAGNTVRIIDDRKPQGNYNRLVERPSMRAAGFEALQPRSDLLYCNLLVVNELPSDADEAATLAEILLKRFEYEYSTLITTSLTPLQIINGDKLPHPHLLERCPPERPVSNSTERLLIVLNIGVSASPDRPFDAPVRQRVTTPWTASQKAVYYKLNFTPLSMIDCHLTRQSFRADKDGKLRDWHLFVMDQRPYRYHPKHWMGHGIEQSKWPEETVAWLKELGPNYKPD